MLNSKQLLDKLQELPLLFRHYYYRKEWSRAKHCYDTARTVAVFAEVNDKVKMQLFGNRPYINEYEEMADGLFPEKMVERAYLECIKANDTYEQKPYPGIPKRT